MLGVGTQEMLLIGLLCLLVFGPSKISNMARDLGGLVRKARRSVDEFKSELTLDEAPEDFRERFSNTAEEVEELGTWGLETDQEWGEAEGSAETCHPDPKHTRTDRSDGRR